MIRRPVLTAIAAVAAVAVGALCGPAATAAATPGAPLPRTVLALYDGGQEDNLRLTRIHQMAEMPLNHLGLSVVYADIREGLPDLAAYPGLRGIVTWFVTDRMPAPEAYLDWLSAALDRGTRLAILGSVAAYADLDGRRVPIERVNRVLARLGLRDEGEWSDLTYAERPTVKVSRMVEFERALGPVLPPHGVFTKIDPAVESHLVLRDRATAGTESHLVVTGGAGGFAAADYARFFDEHLQRRMWRIDPFEFFRRAFATDDLPKPDTTTLAGRRLYYSHIDGDGWLNVTTVPHDEDRRILSSEIIQERVIKTHPDLPITVAPITAELESAWVGTEEARAIARETLALPWVEAASHTTSHPFRWQFYRDYTRAKEETFMRQAIARQRHGEQGLEELSREALAEAELNPFGFHLAVADQPRAYMKHPYDLDDEIGGSIAFVRTLLPPGKDVRILQWSGDCQPYPAAIAATRRAGVPNINGGDTRFDSAFPSYATVAPIGVLVEGQRQIYASNSNENTYTDLWSSRYFAFRTLRETVRNTETPIRVKPFNIYYHMYSGEKTASLNAVLGNLELARASDIAPVTTSHFAIIAEGFYTTRLIVLGERRWRIEDRGALQTLRFDRSSFATVDYARSEGVIGQRHFQGSLYVALDPAHPAPVVALADDDRPDQPPAADVAYLVDSRWPVERLERTADGLTVRASGFGAGAMTWRMPAPGRYEIDATDQGGALVWHGMAETDTDQRLRFTVGTDGITPLTLSIRRTGPRSPA